MITVFYDEMEAEKRIKDKLAYARFILELFPRIYKPFSKVNFDCFSLHDFLHSFIRVCVPESFLFAEYISVETLKFLRMVDESLAFVEQTKNDLNFVYKRIVSHDLDQVISAINELLFMHFLLSKSLKKMITPYPRLSSGKESDVKINYNGVDFYIEIGTLGTRLSEKRIQEIFDEVAKWFRDETKDKKLISYWRFDVDTYLLPQDAEKHILVKEGIASLKKEFERLEPEMLYGMNGSIDLVDAARCYPYLDKIREGSTEYTSLNLGSNIARQWLKQHACALNDIKFIKRISTFRDYVHPRVEIAFQEEYPSKLSETLLNAVSSHIVRHVKEQLNQLQRDSPNIIALNIRHWSLDFVKDDIKWSGKPYTFNETLYKKLQPYLTDLFKDENANNLLGIILYNNMPDDGIFIENKDYYNKNTLCKIKELMTKLNIYHL